MDSTLPWKDLIQAGFGSLNIMPAAFWQLTPTELYQLLRSRFPADNQKPMLHGELEQMKARFPD